MNSGTNRYIAILMLFVALHYGGAYCGSIQETATDLINHTPYKIDLSRPEPQSRPGSKRLTRVLSIAAGCTGIGLATFFGHVAYNKGQALARERQNPQIDTERFRRIERQEAGSMIASGLGIGMVVLGIVGFSVSF